MTNINKERPVKWHTETILDQKSSHQMTEEELDCCDWQDGFDYLLESAQIVARRLAEVEADLEKANEC